MTNAKLSEESLVNVAVANADISTARTSAAYLDVSGYRDVRGVAAAFAISDTETVTCQLMQATDAGGTGAKVLGTAVVETSDGGDAILQAIQEADVSSMDHANGFTFVGVRISSSEAILGTGLVQRGNPRFKPAA